MAALVLKEESAERLSYRVSAMAMIRHMALLIFAVVVITLSLCLFLRVYIGVLAFVLVGIPGLIGVVCGCMGCANARPFTFTFDLARDELVAEAGSARLEQSLRQVMLVYVERECSTGGTFSGESAPSYAVSLMFVDGRRLRLEGGTSATGSGRGPDNLHAHAAKIRDFLRLPQEGVPVLDVTNAAKDKMEEGEAQAWLLRLVSCQGLAPRMLPGLYEYVWVEAPQCVTLPQPVPRPGGLGRPMYVQQRPAPMGGGYAAGAGEAPGGAFVARRQNHWGNTPTVVGRVYEPPTRAMQLLVPPGATAGTSITAVAPDGTQVVFEIPPGILPGHTLTVQY